MQIVRRKFNVNQYHHMVETGILKPNDRLELIRGEIVEMSPIGTKHAAYVKRLNALFANKLGDQVLISVQDPVMLENTSEPQPDIALLQPRDDFYGSQHPRPEDIFLLVEVADRTVKYDSEVKIPLYAESQIQEVWLVNVNTEELKVYRELTLSGYDSISTFRRGQSTHLQQFPEVVFPLEEILG